MVLADGLVEEVAVVADQQHGALIVGEHLLQEVERVHVEIVGRLVEDQELARHGHDLGEQQAVALAARERADRALGLARIEQEILEIGAHMTRLAMHHDLIAARRAQRLPQGLVAVEHGAMLVEIGLGQVLGELDRAAVGLELAGQHAQERRLAGAVGADDADAVAAQDAGREVAHDDALGLLDAPSAETTWRRPWPR